MPYCPKCDMEFIDGITICSDCGGPLAESKEVCDALKKKTKEEALARLKSQYDAMTEDATAESHQPLEQSGILEDSQAPEEFQTPLEAKTVPPPNKAAPRRTPISMLRELDFNVFFISSSSIH